MNRYIITLCGVVEKCNAQNPMQSKKDHKRYIFMIYSSIHRIMYTSGLQSIHEFEARIVLGFLFVIYSSVLFLVNFSFNFYGSEHAHK
jgi:hypothetical protein